MAEVLIVSPDNRDAHQLLSIVESVNHKAVLISDISDAKLYLNNNNPDLVIAEQELEDSSGVDFFDYLCKSKEKVYPFILLSSISLSALAGKALQKGALDFLPRPLDAEEVITIIERAINKRPVTIFSENQVGFEAKGDILIITIPDHFIHEAAVQLSKLLNVGALMTERGLIIDLSNSSYIASIGIGILQVLASNFIGSEAKLMMCGASPRIYHLMDIAGIFHFYKYKDNLEEALQDFDGV
ncbi:MAG: STAS domain-containing protein [Planctomycetota bacterium]|jgi:anti-anti-sigma factor